jgi:hypothetical protein
MRWRLGWKVAGVEILICDSDPRGDLFVFSDFLTFVVSFSATGGKGMAGLNL